MSILLVNMIRQTNILTQMKLFLSLHPVVIKTPSWGPDHEQETSFRGGKTQSAKLKESSVEKSYHVLSKETGQTPEAFHFDNFELRDGKLYYKGKSTSLAIRGGKLRSFGEIVKILGKERLHNLGFDIPITDKLTARQAIMLNRVEEWKKIYFLCLT